MADRGARAALAGVVAALALFGLTACSSQPSVAPAATGGDASTEPSGYDHPALRFDDHVVSIEIADEPHERQLGLMHRTELGPNDGMLFLFGRPTTDGFWMKNTLIPLSIAFLRDLGEGRFKVVKVLDMEPCRLADTSRCPRYRPGTSYDAALEVNRGWFEDAGIGVGASARYEPGP